MSRDRYLPHCMAFLIAGALAGFAPVAMARPASAAGLQDARESGLPIVHTVKHPGSLPVVVVVAQDEAVLSDFVVPYGILAQSRAAKVIALNLTGTPLPAGPITLVPDMSVAAFDRAYPDGADYVIVPATADKHEDELAWLRTQRARGAALISICDGVEVLAETGALDGRKATGHWASLDERRTLYPRVTWLTNVRYVADGDLASSAGVSAALPISLALVQTLAGRPAAQATADRLGVAAWGAVHDSDIFKLRADDRAVHRRNMHARHNDVVAIEVGEGDDEVALSLEAEAWSRTMRNEVHLVSDTGGVVRLRGGLRVQTLAASAVKPDVRIPRDEAVLAGRTLPATFDLIARRYGRGTARLSALGMEYPWGDLKAPR